MKRFEFYRECVSIPVLNSKINYGLVQINALPPA
jgi:hypothetical protein